MIAIVSNVARLSGVRPEAEREIKSNLTLRNPEFEQRERSGASTADTPAVICYCKTMAPGDLVIPRGALAIAKTAARRCGAQFNIEDRTRMLPEVDIRFVGSLRLYQAAAAAAVLRRYSSVLDAPTGSGKTITSLWVAAKLRQPTLVLVPTQKLLDQWVEDAGEFLQLPSPVGIIGGGKMKPGRELTIGIVNSVAKVAKEIEPLFGHIIPDECHRAPGKRYWETVSTFKARYRYGLSATPYRRDTLSKAIGWLLGPVVRVDRGPLVELGAILPAEIEQRPTDFFTYLNASDNYAAVIYELLANQERNGLIIHDAMEMHREGLGINLLLTDHRGHAGLLAAYMRLQGVDCAVLVGRMGKRKTEFYDKALGDGRIRTIAATTAFVGEGWDFPAVGSVQLTAPIKFKGKLIQAIGRALRPYPGMDRAKIIDHVDHKVPQLLASARARATTYRTEITQWKEN